MSSFAAIAVGLAAGTKYTGLPCALPLIVAHFAACAEKNERPFDKRLLLALVLNAGVQLVLAAIGHVHRTADKSRLVAGLDEAMRCPTCGSSEISRSTPQPLDRCVLHLNPMTPFRCLSCWHRYWRVKPPLAALVSSCLGAAVLVFGVTAALRFRARRREIQGRRLWLTR